MTFVVCMNALCVLAMTVSYRHSTFLVFISAQILVILNKVLVHDVDLLVGTLLVDLHDVLHSLLHQLLSDVS